MKTKHIVVLMTGITALAAAGFMGAGRERQLVVHEWGTFTSLQGSDGVPLKWNPLASSRLPAFVYNWMRPGFGRRPTGMLSLGNKGALVTLQRMETPVVYFYTPEQIKIDLTVRFPNGGITEWYPQAADVGPSVYPLNPVIAGLDSGLHQCGVAPTFTLASVFQPRTQKESLIRWTDLNIITSDAHFHRSPRLLADSSGSHYYAARETDSALIELPQSGGTNEIEKFLFYRGVGNFVATLRVAMPDERTVLMSNTGTEPLSYLFILGIQGERGDFVSLERLGPCRQTNASLELKNQGRSLKTLRKQIQSAMAQALSAEGLYPREAAAMVKTWDNSWFTEPGVRVLYMLPRAWTDQTLPMSIDPKPKELVRVMVGRAELI